jgi:hypothetical protein
VPYQIKLHRKRRAQLRVTQVLFAVILGLTTLWSFLKHDAIEKDWVNDSRAVTTVGIGTCFLIALSIAAMNFVTKRRERWRGVSFLTALILMIGTVTCWWIVSNRTPKTYGFGELVHNETDTTKLLKKYLKPDAKPYKIPTGFFIQSAEFTNGSNVDITGYIWQKYGNNIPKNITEGFVLPEALEAYEVTEAYRSQRADYKIVGWYFHATLRQQFFYQLYPLDNQDVWLRIWHKNFEQGAILVPDFDSYSRPYSESDVNGVDAEFVRDGWDMAYTSFNFNNIKYTTSFGLGSYKQGKPFPELYYCVGMKRNFRGPLITRIIPMGVVTILLYAVLVATRKSVKSSELIGFNTFAVLSYCAALFFVVTIDHAGLKNLLGQSNICYLDYFYFTIYIAILLVSINSIVLTNSKQNHRIVEYGDNLIPKYLFWPFVLGSIFLVTVLTF